MSDIAIRVEKLSKQYRIGGGLEEYKTLRETLTRSFTAPFRRLSTFAHGRAAVPSNQTIWALKDVSFEVKPGEILGIIGRNGAGKSTLLKILSRITEPTKGYAEVHGRVGSLLEVGTGFHPELTGRENIYLNGAILGMKKAEIESKFDEIVAFAEIEKFIDTPVKHYSSGMHTRLAFSVAAHLEPDILLVDEVLAVGDAAFQKKCFDHLMGFQRQGRTVLVVSHNLISLEAMCDRALVLSHGEVVAQNQIVKAIEIYRRILREETAERASRGVGRGQESPIFEIRSIELVDCTTCAKDIVLGGSCCKLSIRYFAHEPLRNARITWHIWEGNQRLFTADSQYDNASFLTLVGSGKLECEFTMPRLISGVYTLKVSLGEEGSPVRLGEWGWRDEFYSFRVELESRNEIAPKDEWGVGHLTGSWRTIPKD